MDDDQPVLLYDGGCGFCQRWVAWAQSRGADVLFRPCKDAKTLREAHGIPDEFCERTAVFIHGHKSLTHEQAIYSVMLRLPGRRNMGWRMLGRLGRVPFPFLFWPFDALGYRWVARNRHRFRGPKTPGDSTAEESA